MEGLELGRKLFDEGGSVDVPEQAIPKGRNGDGTKIIGGILDER